MVKQINKEWYKSKTVWAASVALVIAVLTSVLGSTNPIVGTVIALASAIGLYGRSVAQGPLA